ncbi:putative lipopolysaccharide heptosyltransferase III [Nitratifractor sp.]
MNILLVKLNHIGDTLLLTPTIHGLKSRYPSARIDVVVRKGTEGVLEGNPDIDRLFAFASPDRKKRRFGDRFREAWGLIRFLACRRYDYAFDLSNSDRAKLSLLLSCARHRAINDWHNDLGWKRRLFTDFSHFAWGPEHQVLKDYRTVSEILPLDDEPGPLVLETDEIPSSLLDRYNLQCGSYIVIHPTSRWSYKEWPLQQWGEVIAALENKGHHILLTSGPDPREIEIAHELLGYSSGRTVATFGQTSLRESAYLIRHARLFVGIDTVAMHIAAAVQTPVVALFGPSSEWSWHPWKVPHRLVLGDCPCKRSRNFTCDMSHLLPCMAKIESSQVLENIEDLLKETHE